jgi:hypothetical protein
MTQTHARMKYNATVPGNAARSTGASPEGKGTREFYELSEFCELAH